MDYPQSLFLETLKPLEPFTSLEGSSLFMLDFIGKVSSLVSLFMKKGRDDRSQEGIDFRYTSTSGTFRMTTLWCSAEGPTLSSPYLLLPFICRPCPTSSSSINVLLKLGQDKSNRKNNNN